MVLFRTQYSLQRSNQCSRKSTVLSQLALRPCNFTHLLNSTLYLIAVELVYNTRIPSQRETAFSGLRARSVLRARNALILPMLALSANMLTVDICNVSTAACLHQFKVCL